MKVSDCCGAGPIENMEDLGICMECKEHCEYVEELPNNWDECICKKCGHSWKAGLTDEFNFTFCNSCGSVDIEGPYHEED